MDFEEEKEKTFTYMEIGRIISYIIDIAESERDFGTKAEIIAETLVNDLGIKIED